MRRISKLVICFVFVVLVGMLPIKVQAADKQQVKAFCERMYTVVLNRNSDEKGLNDWTRQLLAQEIDGAGIAYGFVMSKELTDRHLSDDEYLRVLYKTFFNREADEGGFTYWMEQIKNGKTRANVLSGFVNSKEFKELTESFGILRGRMYENGLPAKEGLEGYVERLYVRALDRKYDVAGKQNWMQAIKEKRKTADDVAEAFFFSKEFINRNLSNEDFVEVLYVTFMDRKSDPVGKASWVEKLDQGLASRENVINGFLHSKEFQNILISYGLGEGHLHEWKTIVLESTCIEEGKEITKCITCGELKDSRKLPLISHKYEEDVVVEATTEIEGKIQNKCIECSAIEPGSEKVIPMLSGGNNEEEISRGENGVTVPSSEDTSGDLVWVPTNGGKKYHSKSTCSNMEEPMHVTKQHAEENGYTACKRCY